MDAHEAAAQLDQVRSARRRAWRGPHGSGRWFVLSSALLLAWGVVQDLAPDWGGVAFFALAGVALTAALLPVTRQALFRTGLPQLAGPGSDPSGTLRRAGLVAGLTAAAAATVAFAVLAEPAEAEAGRPASSTLLALGVVAGLGVLEGVDRLTARRRRAQP